MAPIDAFRAIALCCLGQLQRNEAGAICGDHPEYVLPGPVAIRRLRSAFRLFAPVLGPDFIAVYSPRWREVATVARDWDVFLSETLPPLEEVFRTRRAGATAPPRRGRARPGTGNGPGDPDRGKLQPAVAGLRRGAVPGRTADD